MSGTTRAQFLSRGTRGGLALIAGGSILSLAEGAAFGAGTADTDIAKLAATAELLAIDFYTHAIASGKLQGRRARLPRRRARRTSRRTTRRSRAC